MSHRLWSLPWVALLACQLFLAQSVSADVTYTIDRDIGYWGDDAPDDYAEERCRLDVYRPEGGEAFPTVIWFHAGGLTAGERFIPGELRKSGMAIVAADYRLNPKAEAPAYLEDAAAATAWVLDNIEALGGDPDRVYITGASAGGYLATMVGLDDRWLAAHDKSPSDLAGIISLSGQMITHFTVRKEQGVTGTQPVIDDMSPLFHVKPDAPKLVLITGDRDVELFGRYEENAYMWRMMQVVGHKDTTIYELDGFNHGQMTQPALFLMRRLVLEDGEQ